LSQRYGKKNDLPIAIFVYWTFSSDIFEELVKNH